MIAAWNMRQRWDGIMRRDDVVSRVYVMRVMRVMRP